MKTKLHHKVLDDPLSNWVALQKSRWIRTKTRRSINKVQIHEWEGTVERGDRMDFKHSTELYHFQFYRYLERFKGANHMIITSNPCKREVRGHDNLKNLCAGTIFVFFSILSNRFRTNGPRNVRLRSYWWLEAKYAQPEHRNHMMKQVLRLKLCPYSLAGFF